MKALCTLTVLLLAGPCPSDPPAEATVIAYTKAIDVAKLDPALESRPLDEWLRLGPPHIDEPQWRMSDCDLKPDYPEPDEGYPLCVRIGFHRGRVAGWLIVTVGTMKNGIHGPPRFEHAVVSAPSASGTMRVERAKTLAGLPTLVDDLLGSAPQWNTSIRTSPAASMAGTVRP